MQLLSFQDGAIDSNVRNGLLSLAGGSEKLGGERSPPGTHGQLPRRMPSVRQMQPLLPSLQFNAFTAKLQELQSAGGLVGLQALELQREGLLNGRLDLQQAASLAQLQEMQQAAGRAKLQELQQAVGRAKLQDLHGAAGLAALQDLQQTGLAKLQDLQSLSGLAGLPFGGGRAGLQAASDLASLHDAGMLSNLQGALNGLPGGGGAFLQPANGTAKPHGKAASPLLEPSAAAKEHAALPKDLPPLPKDLPALPADLTALAKELPPLPKGLPALPLPKFELTDPAQLTGYLVDAARASAPPPARSPLRRKRPLSTEEDDEHSEPQQRVTRAAAGNGRLTAPEPSCSPSEDVSSGRGLVSSPSLLVPPASSCRGAAHSSAHGHGHLRPMHSRDLLTRMCPCRDMQTPRRGRRRGEVARQPVVGRRVAEAQEACGKTREGRRR